MSLKTEPEKVLHQPVLQHSADLITRNAAHLSIVELALGSLAHAFHIPFTGHILSLNQAAFLCHGCKYSMDRRSSAQACYEISGVAATLKSLAPTGKKLGPMLALVMQGLLFSIGIVLFGKKKFGQIVGMILLSTWAFIHPLITLLISFGPKQLENVVQFYTDKINVDYYFAGYAVFSVIAILFLMKAICGLFIVQWIDQSDEKKWASWQDHLISRSQKVIGPSRNLKSFTQNSSPLKGALRDLLRPLFLFSFALTWIFLFVQKDSWTSFTWLALRPVAIAFVIFYLLRSPQFLKLCAAAAEKFGFLRPIHRRLLEVRKYWDLKTTTNSSEN